MEKKNLKELQADWYQKLKDEGFKDIEDTNSPREWLKEWDSIYFQIRFTPETFSVREEYYALATRFLEQHKFENQVEREIWRLHADGLSIRGIAKTLREAGSVIYKDTVHKVVRTLAALMKNNPRMGNGPEPIKRTCIKRRDKQ